MGVFRNPEVIEFSSLGFPRQIKDVHGAICEKAGDADTHVLIPNIS
jgi:hypothetical protein